MFLKKVNADFDLMLKIVERKRTEITMKIKETYDNHIKKNSGWMSSANSSFSNFTFGFSIDISQT